MSEIKIGDIYLANIGGVVPGFAGTLRPVKVIGIQKYYYECETVPYPDCFGELSKPYRIDYFGMELTRKFRDEAMLKEWMRKNPMGEVIFFDKDENNKHPKQAWSRKVGEFFGNETNQD